MAVVFEAIAILSSLLHGVLLYTVCVEFEDQEARTVVASVIVLACLCHIVLHRIHGIPCLLHPLATRIYGALRTLLSDANATVNTELRRALAKIDELEVKNQELQVKNHALQAENQQLQAKNRQLEDDNLELEIECHAQEAELEDARADYPLLALAARSYEHSVRLLQSDVHFLQDDVHFLEHENRQLKLAKRQSEDELRRVNRQSEDLLRARIRSLESYTKVLQRDLQQANRVIAMERSVRIAERDVHIAENAALRVQAEEALMQLQANERQTAKHDEEVNAVVAERNALKLELLERDHTISDLQLQVANHDVHEQNLRQRNSELRERNRDLRLRNGELQRQQETDAVTLFCANMALLRRHEQPLAFPSGNTIATAQPAVTVSA
ncbi:hypothetical protein K525DRAFT_245588 [Schizophyllum commune Loenen D]|nr:hypothetical protein K525DRAFT_245588 [Schizophyllum commune Loenen D]